jgi:molybdopterin/thiamine biosynthesis adenylyltransferase
MSLTEHPVDVVSQENTTSSTDVVITATMWQALRAHLLRSSTGSRRSSPDEQLAFLLASINRNTRGQRLLVREMLPAGPDDLVRQGPTGIAPRPEFVLRALNRCKDDSLHLVEVHSHPFSHGPGTTFSGIDWANDRGKMPGIAALLENFIHATMVVGQDSLDAHFYDRTTRHILPIARVVIVGFAPGSEGPGLHIIPTSSASEMVQPDGATGSNRYHRQELLFGREIQRRLANVTIAIVGLGGLGSFVALELAHLGVGHLILIDPDHIEETNLNRLPGVGPADIDQTKVSVYETLLKRIAPAMRVEALASSIMDNVALALAKGADILVGCLDNHGARMILNQLAVRYLIPLIDGGSGLKRNSADASLRAGGQVQVVLPGIGCLECRGFIDMRRATFDLAPPELQEEERAHGYGMDEPAPAVISLNGVIASALVTEIMLLLAGSAIKSSQRLPPISLYDAFHRSLIAIEPHDFPDCLTCGSDGIQGIGDLAPIRVVASGNSEKPVAEAIPQNLTVAEEQSQPQEVEASISSSLPQEERGSPGVIAGHFGKILRALSFRRRKDRDAGTRITR